jgi:hypothetical protein
VLERLGVTPEGMQRRSRLDGVVELQNLERAVVRASQSSSEL